MFSSLREVPRSHLPPLHFNTVVASPVLACLAPSKTGHACCGTRPALKNTHFSQFPGQQQGHKHAFSNFRRSD